MNDKTQNSASSAPLLEIREMSKRFGATVALDKVDLTVRPGEILGLIGENGSGKSTVCSIFSGIQPSDSGVMLFHGKPWAPASMQEALQGGIGIIVQENGTIPDITVAENIFLCRADEFAVLNRPNGKKWGWIREKELFRKAQNALRDIGADEIDAESITRSLDLMERKLIEVAKVWMQSPEILVVDESTTALSQRGREILYRLMETLKSRGGAVVFISHDLDEIMERCDRLTVLRDGKIIRSFEKEEFDADRIRTSMIGRTLQGNYYRTDTEGSHGKEVVIEAKNLSYGKHLHGVNLKVHRGEILGIGGLSQCGMHSLGKLLFGAIAPTSGSVHIKGQPIRTPRDAIRVGVGYAAKDRDTESLCLSASVKDNIAVTGYSRFAVGGVLLLPAREKAYAQEMIDFMKIKTSSPDQPIWQLSGGNKQKAVFGKWIGAKSEILILDCPTRGIDIGVKQTMYRLMERMKAEGKTVVIISEELSELIGMSDRIVILKNGKISREFDRHPNLSDAEIIHHMI